MHTKEKVGTLNEWCSEFGKAMEEAYLAWLFEVGSFRKGKWFHWDSRGGYVDMITGYFVPVGDPKWKKIKL
jgi:hypothetical protein